MIAGTTQRMRDIAFLIELDELRSANAAVDPVIFSADLVGIGFRRAIQKPDVVILIDEDTGDLLHAPSVRQRLRPERIDLEERRTIGVDSLSLPLLRALDRTSGENQNATHHENHQMDAASLLRRFHENPLLRVFYYEAKDIPIKGNAQLGLSGRLRHFI